MDFLCGVGLLVCGACIFIMNGGAVLVYAGAIFAAWITPRVLEWLSSKCCFAAARPNTERLTSPTSNVNAGGQAMVHTNADAAVGDETPSSDPFRECRGAGTVVFCHGYGRSEGAPTEKVAVYGGSFDPPHKSHLSVIETIANKDAVSKVIVVPSGGDLSDYVKPGKTSYKLRFAWTEKMVEDLDHAIRGKVEVSNIESECALDTFALILALAKNEKLSLNAVSIVVGSDYADSLHRWSDDPRWLQMCFLVSLRDGEDEEQVSKKMIDHGWSPAQLCFFTAPANLGPVPISSSAIKRVAFEKTSLTQSVDQLRSKGASLTRFSRRHNTDPGAAVLDIALKTQDLQTKERAAQKELDAVMTGNVLKDLEVDKARMSGMKVLAAGFKAKKPEEAKQLNEAIFPTSLSPTASKHKTMPSTFEDDELSGAQEGAAGGTTLLQTLFASNASRPRGTQLD